MKVGGLPKLFIALCLRKFHEKIFFVFKIAMAVKIIIPDSLMNLFGRMVRSGN